MPASPDDIARALSHKRAATEQPIITPPRPAPSATPKPSPPTFRDNDADDRPHTLDRAPAPQPIHARQPALVDTQQSPPHSVEAEQGILSSLMTEPRWAIPIALEKVSRSFFYIPAHQTIFSDLIDLFTEKGDADLITFTQYLRDINHLDGVGGASFVTSLYTFVPTARNIDFYIDTVRDKYVLRQLIAANTEFVQRAMDPVADADSLLREFAERAERTIKTARGGSSLPPLSDMSTMLGKARPPAPPELVQTILHQGSKLIVGGTSKGRKTFALLDLAISVATGTPWWGFTTAQGAVCYINFEIQESFFSLRIEDICRAKGFPDTPLTLPTSNFMGWNLRGLGDGIENMVDDLLFVLRQRQFSLIVIDPIYKALGNRDENKAGDVASMLNQLERIAVRTGAAVAFGAHYSKGNQAAKESIDRIGGSGVFARDPDSILTMTAHEEEEAFTVDATLRNFKPVDPFVVKWDWPIFYRKADLDPDTLKQPKKDGASGQFKTKYSTDDILPHLSVLDGITPAALKTKTNTLRSMSKATFYRLAGELEKRNLLLDTDGKWLRKL